jgi:hypothetical protein
VTFGNVVASRGVIDHNVDTLSAVAEYLEFATASGYAHAKVLE